MDAKRYEKAAKRMNWLFYGSVILQFLSLVAIGIGLIARGYKHHWGIWFSIPGWIVFFSGYLIQSWVRSWFYKHFDK